MAEDGKGKVLKARTRLGDAIGSACDASGVTAGAFAGLCSGDTGSALRDCLAARVACRVCQGVNDMDGIAVDCDTFNDGVANLSCP